MFSSSSLDTRPGSWGMSQACDASVLWVPSTGPWRPPPPPGNRKALEKTSGAAPPAGFSTCSSGATGCVGRGGDGLSEIKPGSLSYDSTSSEKQLDIPLQLLHRPGGAHLAPKMVVRSREHPRSDFSSSSSNPENIRGLIQLHAAEHPSSQPRLAHPNVHDQTRRRLACDESGELSQQPQR